MKNSLLIENQEIIQLIFDLNSSLPGHSKGLSQILHTFRGLETKWLGLVESCEVQQKSLKDRHSRTESNLSYYKQVHLKQKLRLTQFDSKERQVKNMHESVASHLKVFPKLWNQNLKRLKKKSVSWRFTPFASPTYDQEFEFLQSQKAKKGLDSKAMQEAKLTRTNAKNQYLNAKPPKYSQRKVIENLTQVSEHNDSIEFERLMNEISANKGNESGLDDKSGWRSEYDSETDSNNVSEIKKAISILYKANLLQPESRQVLSKITDLAKNPEASDKLVLYLQLLSINQSFLPSFNEKSIENDVKIEELLEATSFLSSFGPQRLESSLLEYSSMLENREKRGSIGKCSTKEMT